MSIVLFEDDLVCRLDPVALGKPAFTVSCGAVRLVDLVAGWNGPLHAQVRTHLQAIVAADYPGLQQSLPESSGTVLWVNARVVPSRAAGELLRAWWKSGEAGVIRTGQAVAAALVPAGKQAADWSSLAGLELPAREGELPPSISTPRARRNKSADREVSNIRGIHLLVLRSGFSVLGSVLGFCDARVPFWGRGGAVLLARTKAVAQGFSPASLNPNATTA